MKLKILIVSARYYKGFSKSLELYAVSTLDVKKIKYKIIPVPGVFEIPVVIAKNIKKYDGFIALGCVIKGETPHFDFISHACLDGLQNIAIETGIPMICGVLTTNNIEQAKERSDSNRMNKGKEFALSAMNMVDALG